MHLKRFARLGFAVLAVTYIGGLSLWASQGESGKVRAFVTGRFALVIDGKPVGFIGSFEGGEPFADAVLEKSGSVTALKKRIGPIRYDPIELSAPVPLAPALLDWIAANIRGTTPKSGSVAVYDASGKAIAGKEFLNALISEISFPTMDASSKSSGQITLKLALEGSRALKAAPPMPTVAARSKVWLPSNFRFEIDGIDASRVSKIDALTIKQKVAEFRSGGEQGTRLVAGQVDPSNIRILVPESFAGAWDQWFDDFAIKGNNGDSKEKKGSIVLLDASLKEPLLRINLSNLGILSVKRQAFGSTSPIRQVAIELYCERIEIVP